MATSTFTGKTALITGAAAGLGKAISIAFFNAGASLVLIDINEPPLLQTYHEITGSESEPHKRAIHITVDITNEASVADLYSSALTNFGRLDILVNNAGIMDRFDSVGQVEKDLWDRVLAVNVTGPMLMSRAFVNALQGREGVILNVASTAGLKGFVAGVAYTTSKHALLGLTKNTAAFYAKRGVRCNAILPGGMEGTNIATAFSEGMNQDGYNTMLMSAAMEPASCSVDKMAKLVLYICSDDGSVLNGACVTADGGWTAY